jgi:hypothetical protein
MRSTLGGYDRIGVMYRLCSSSRWYRLGFEYFSIFEDFKYIFVVVVTRGSVIVFLKRWHYCFA